MEKRCFSRTLVITATNAINYPNFGNPDLNISRPGTVAGSIRSVQDRDFGGPREVMIGLRHEF